ncbi:hypothetical protein NNO_0040 [Hydrogenimonas sp.]|nr:hypothetical protein NNO_0040 [Hydrogenimonas sp.]
MYDDDTIMAIYDVHRGGISTTMRVKTVKAGTQHKRGTKESLKRSVPGERRVKVCRTHIDIRQGMRLRYKLPRVCGRMYKVMGLSVNRASYSGATQRYRET